MAAALVTDKRCPLNYSVGPNFDCTKVTHTGEKETEKGGILAAPVMKTTHHTSLGQLAKRSTVFKASINLPVLLTREVQVPINPDSRCCQKLGID